MPVYPTVIFIIGKEPGFPIAKGTWGKFNHFYYCMDYIYCLYSLCFQICNHNSCCRQKHKPDNYNSSYHYVICVGILIDASTTGPT